MIKELLETTPKEEIILHHWWFNNLFDSKRICCKLPKDRHIVRQTGDLTECAECGVTGKFMNVERHIRWHLELLGVELG